MIVEEKKFKSRFIESMKIGKRSYSCFEENANLAENI